jgi:hypothetical protein
VPRQAIIKPQYVDHIPKAVKGQVGELLQKKDERQALKAALDFLDLHNVLERNIEVGNTGRRGGAGRYNVSETSSWGIKGHLRWEFNVVGRSVEVVWGWGV